MPEKPTAIDGVGGTRVEALGELPPLADDKLMHVILANLFAGVMLARASDGRILFANPRFSAMFGYGPGELERGSPSPS